MLQKSLIKLQSEKENIYKSYVDLKEDLNIINELKIKINESERVNENLRYDLEQERAKGLNVVKMYNVKIP
jgi:hypothetical protein